MTSQDTRAFARYLQLLHMIVKYSIECGVARFPERKLDDARSMLSKKYITRQGAEKMGYLENLAKLNVVRIDVAPNGRRKFLEPTILAPLVLLKATAFFENGGSSQLAKEIREMDISTIRKDAESFISRFMFGYCDKGFGSGVWNFCLFVLQRIVYGLIKNYLQRKALGTNISEAFLHFVAEAMVDALVKYLIFGGVRKANEWETKELGMLIRELESEGFMDDFMTVFEGLLSILEKFKAAYLDVLKH